MMKCNFIDKADGARCFRCDADKQLNAVELGKDLPTETGSGFTLRFHLCERCRLRFRAILTGTFDTADEIRHSLRDVRDLHGPKLSKWESTFIRDCIGGAGVLSDKQMEAGANIIKQYLGKVVEY